MEEEHTGVAADAGGEGGDSLSALPRLTLKQVWEGEYTTFRCTPSDRAAAAAQVLATPWAEEAWRVWYQVSKGGSSSALPEAARDEASVLALAAASSTAAATHCPRPIFFAAHAMDSVASQAGAVDSDTAAMAALEYAVAQASAFPCMQQILIESAVASQLQASEPSARRVVHAVRLAATSALPSVEETVLRWLSDDAMVALCGTPAGVEVDLAGALQLVAGAAEAGMARLGKRLPFERDLHRLYADNSDDDACRHRVQQYVASLKWNPKRRASQLVPSLSMQHYAQLLALALSYGVHLRLEEATQLHDPSLCLTYALQAVATATAANGTTGGAAGAGQATPAWLACIRCMEALAAHPSSGNAGDAEAADDSAFLPLHQLKAVLSSSATPFEWDRCASSATVRSLCIAGRVLAPAMQRWAAKLLPAALTAVGSAHECLAALHALSTSHAAPRALAIMSVAAHAMEVQLPSAYEYLRVLLACVGTLRRLCTYQAAEPAAGVVREEGEGEEDDMIGPALPGAAPAAPESGVRPTVPAVTQLLRALVRMWYRHQLDILFYYYPTWSEGRASLQLLNAAIEADAFSDAAASDAHVDEVLVYAGTDTVADVAGSVSTPAAWKAACDGQLILRPAELRLAYERAAALAWRTGRLERVRTLYAQCLHRLGNARYVEGADSYAEIEPVCAQWEAFEDAVGTWESVTAASEKISTRRAEVAKRTAAAAAKAAAAAAASSVATRREAARGAGGHAAAESGAGVKRPRAAMLASEVGVDALEPPVSAAPAKRRAAHAEVEDGMHMENALVGEAGAVAASSLSAAPLSVAGVAGALFHATNANAPAAVSAQGAGTSGSGIAAEGEAPAASTEASTVAREHERAHAPRPPRHLRESEATLRRSAREQGRNKIQLDFDSLKKEQLPASSARGTPSIAAAAPAEVEVKLAATSQPAAGADVDMSAASAAAAAPPTATVEPLEYEDDKIILFNLPFEHTTIPGLIELFTDCGAVLDARLINSTKGKRKGMAWVRFAAADSVPRALAKNKTVHMGGREVVITRALKPASQQAHARLAVVATKERRPSVDAAAEADHTMQSRDTHELASVPGGSGSTDAASAPAPAPAPVPVPRAALLRLKPRAAAVKKPAPSIA